MRLPAPHGNTLGQRAEQDPGKRGVVRPDATSASAHKGETTTPFASLGQRWNKLPFRWQILIAISLVTLVTSMLGGALAVLDAKRRADMETRTNIDLWANHIATKVRAIDRVEQLQQFAVQLDSEMANVRHVSVSVQDKNAETIYDVTERKANLTDDRAPDWFTALVQPNAASRTVEIAPRGDLIGTVTIHGVPDDEIAETWDFLELMGLLWLGAISLMMVGLYFILGLVLNPLATLGSGMKELEDGDYTFRLDIPRVRELDSISSAFNTLAAALDKANTENGRLYRQLIAVQEEERREISRDLHDEFGPCLFAIMAGTTAVAHHARQLPDAKAAPILSCVDEIVQVSTHLKSMNRALLNRLRPIALGRHTIEELISELIGTFKRRHLSIAFDLDSASLPASFGELVDLTVYRCVQEAVTNAIRHGRPSRVGIALALSGHGNTRSVTLHVRDDGAGIPAHAPFGYGLSSMRERVGALDGSVRIGALATRGTCLTVTIPVIEDETRATG
jgi:two-component system, NarL family, sensor histidine kinase UhpB